MCDEVAEFHCGKLLDYTSDSEVQTVLEKAIEDKERIGLGCIDTLIMKNFYTSASYLFQNYYKKRNLSQKAIWAYRDAMKGTKKQLADLAKLSKRQQTSYVERSPPTEWAQSLDEIQLRIKFSLRHGVPGCVETFDQNITFGRDSFDLTSYCIEGGIKMKYVLSLQLWGTINVEESYYEQQSVGGLIVYMDKDVSFALINIFISNNFLIIYNILLQPRPGRWLTLTLDSERPENLILWYENHKKWWHQLEQFDRDENYEYEGWDFESDEDDEEEDKIWNKPIVRKNQAEKKASGVEQEAPKPKKKVKVKKNKNKNKSKKKGKGKKS